MTRLATLVSLLFCSSLVAQESQLEADLRQERESFSKSCVGLKFVDCIQLLFTDHPFHVAVGSLAPGNGFGSGLAMVTHYTPNEDWRMFFDADAVVSPNLSWRAGGYLTAVYTRPRAIHEQMGTTGHVRGVRLSEKPALHAYVQATSLNKLLYYGLGQDSSRQGQSFFGMTQTIVGGNVIWPIWAALNLSLFGEANGRFVSLRGNESMPGESLGQVYTEASAPGLTSQPGFAQFSQGVRMRPRFASGHVQLNYDLMFQEWENSSTYSFRRFRADFDHQFPLYGSSRSLMPASFNGPDSCLPDPTAKECPTISRNLEGSFGLRLLYTASYFGTGHSVPFYFDPTLGGADIDGNILLGSYPDYRFRAPNLMLVRGTFEHSIGKFPVGIKFMVDEGRVALDSGDLGFNHLAHSYAAGLTLHAGGLPLIDLLFAWGGNEGTHTIANVSPSLLGGAFRPSLY